MTSETTSMISSIPTFVMSSIDPGHLEGASRTLASVVAAMSTAKEMETLSQYLVGASATMNIIEAQNLLLTATDTLAKSQATHTIFDSTSDLKALEWLLNLYGEILSTPPNAFYCGLFGALFVFYASMIIKSRFWWFNISFFCGSALEFAGFVGRTLSCIDLTIKDYFLLQIITLTIAPAFIMGGIYYQLAQMIVVYGKEYALFKPMMYSYFFIGCDVLSIVLQAIGGALASIADDNQGTWEGTYVMIAGLACQVVSMSIFLSLLIHFLMKIYSKHSQREDISNISASLFCSNLFNTKSARAYRLTKLEPFYNKRFNSLRSRELFIYLPLATLCGTICIYIRCIYRLVELSFGFNGYIITHEIFLFVLDALFIAIALLVFTVFHSYFVFGKDSKVITQEFKQDKYDKEHDDFSSETVLFQGYDSSGMTK